MIDQDQVLTALAQASQRSNLNTVPPEGMVVGDGYTNLVAHHVSPVAPALEQRRALIGETLDRHLHGLDYQIRAVLIEDLVRVY